MSITSIDNCGQAVYITGHGAWKVIELGAEARPGVLAAGAIRTLPPAVPAVAPVMAPRRIGYPELA